MDVDWLRVPKTLPGRLVTVITAFAGVITILIGLGVLPPSEGNRDTTGLSSLTSTTAAAIQTTSTSRPPTSTTRPSPGTTTTRHPLEPTTTAAPHTTTTARLTTSTTTAVEVSTASCPRRPSAPQPPENFNGGSSPYVMISWDWPESDSSCYVVTFLRNYPPNQQVVLQCHNIQKGYSVPMFFNTGSGNETYSQLTGQSACAQTPGVIILVEASVNGIKTTSNGIS